MDEKPKSLSDDDIIKGCIHGNPELKEKFVRQFSNLIYKTIHGVLKTKGYLPGIEEIEDLHNTAFVKLFEANCRVLKQYKGKDGCSLATYIRVVCARDVLDHLRRRKDALSNTAWVLPLEAFPMLADKLPSSIDYLEENEKRALVNEALKRLNDREALFIKLHIFKECPVQEVAAVMGVTINNAYSIKHRAIKRLKETVFEMQEN